MVTSRRLQAAMAALLFVALLAPVLPGVNAAVNRPPVSNPGPDETTSESAPGAVLQSSCQDVMDPTLSASSRLRSYQTTDAATSAAPNIVTLSGTNSYDPDGNDVPLTYKWRLVDKPAGAPDLCLKAGGTTGLEKVYVPNILPFKSASYTYTIRLAVLDGLNSRTITDGVTTTGSTTVSSATAVFSGADICEELKTPNLPAGTIIVSRISATDVVVSNAATASGTAQSFAINPGTIPGPDTECGYCNYNPLACKTMSLTVRNTNQPPTLSASPFSLITPRSVDLIDNRGNNGPPVLPNQITFTTAAITDDRETVAAIVTITDPKEAGHNLTVQLSKLSGSSIDPNTHVETSTWRGSLPVDTKEFLTGSYDVTLTAFDADGASATSEAGNIDIDASASLADPRLPVINLNQFVTATPHADSCFPGVKRVSTQVFAPGSVLRPEIFIYPATDPGLYLASGAPDPLLLLRKVTYQVCFQTGSQPGLGPEIPLLSPFYISEDTLFAGQTDVKDLVVKITAYDRQRGVEATAVPLVLGLGNPQVRIERDNVTYQGIPFGYDVYVHDRVDATAQLRIEPFNNTVKVYDVKATNNGTQTPAGTKAFNVPTYASLLRYDIDSDGLCEVLIDANNDAKLDGAWTPLNLSIVPLLADYNSARQTYDYVVDKNGDGRANVGEISIVGNKTTIIEKKGAPPCALPFSPGLTAFLSQGPTQVFIFAIERNKLGLANTTVTVSDVAHNAGQVLKGSFVTEKAGTDARVVSASVGPGPFLPGDLVPLHATVRHEPRAGFKPEPRPALRLALTDNDRSVVMSANRTHPLYTMTPQLTGRQDFDVPLQDREFLPGDHSLVFTVSLPPLVNETDFSNDASSPVAFTVYLGEVVQGSSFASGQRYFIVADRSGLPVLHNGAVEIGADGKVVRKHDLTFAQDPNVRFTFVVSDKTGNHTLYWDPLARYSLTFDKDCAQLSATEREVDRAANPVKDPKCRAITVLAPNQTPVPKKTPGVELGFLVLAIAVFALRRRRLA